MPMYKVVRKCLLKLPSLDAPRICEPGEIVRCDGEPGSCLAPLDREAEDRYVAWVSSKPSHVLKTIREHKQITARAETIKAARAEEAKRAA